MELNEFITKWQGIKGGAERANYQLFLTEFAQALGLPTASPGEQGSLGLYQFDGPVPGGSDNGGVGFIDLYKHACFILEAKQSKLSEVDKKQPQLFDVATSAPASPSGVRYDKLMRDALAQAKRYAVNLPGAHLWPPFLIVCDVGRAFELYFDWSGNGRGYGHFPDQHSYRFELHRFADAKVRDVFRAVWTEPASIDPRAKTAEVTRDVALKLAWISKSLEEANRSRARDAAAIGLQSLVIERTSLFLMRAIFCMFAEDVGLLPKGRFTAFLESCTLDDRTDAAKLIDSEKLSRGLKDLWLKMGSANQTDRWTWTLEEKVRYFNGGLFSDTETYAIGRHDLDSLIAAGHHDWTKVEPAIFGTLLEQALTPSERAKLGAHYTPRPYVERLVQATIMDVLDAEWDAIVHPAAGTVIELAAVRAFHQHIAGLRILDPACGTGNFLYVAMENLMRLEGDVIETIRQLGGEALPQVGPQQFLGLELNPRAAVIAELVLWIGWLRWRMKNDPQAAPDPVLKQFGNINFGGHAGFDAVLRHKATGEADTEHPVIPDWPEADFIIGNPPFIGGKDIRRQLGGDYAEALWRANPRVPKSADFVMQWWDRAAHTLATEGSRLVRFGFVTTNSITQTFSRKVIEGYLSGGRLSLLLAIPDHPWTKATKDSAAVRIAMTVAARGQGNGELVEITREEGLQTDNPKLLERAILGRINPDLSLGSDVTAVFPLRANGGLASPGVKLHGAGFIVTPSEAAHLGLGRRAGLEAHIRPYRNGRDLMQNSRGAMVIDLFGLTEKEVRQRFPEVYQHLDATVRIGREAQVQASATNDAKAYAKTWWLHGKPRQELRPALAGLSRYIATVETAKHRVFQFLDAAILPDNMLIAIGSDDAFVHGVLSSSWHTAWSLGIGGTLEDRPRYNKGQVFDPFPFPDATPAQRAAIADLAEELDATRKAALAEVPRLTMTEIYNLRDRQRASQLKDLMEVERASAARAGIVNRLHEQIDAEVAAAYGWPADLSPAEIVTRLVALNAVRAAEEKSGTIRWLRPEYQRARFADKQAANETGSVSV